MKILTNNAYKKLKSEIVAAKQATLKANRTIESLKLNETLFAKIIQELENRIKENRQHDITIESQIDTIDVVKKAAKPASKKIRKASIK